MNVINPLPSLRRVFYLTFPQIFRPGCKVVLGSGPGQEERFATAVVGATETNGAEVGASCGGSVVLEASLALNHGEGTKVAAARPERVEAANYRKRQVCGNGMRSACGRNLSIAYTVRCLYETLKLSLYSRKGTPYVNKARFGCLIEVLKNVSCSVGSRRTGCVF